MERTSGLNGATSFAAGLFAGALLAERRLCLRLSSTAFLLAGAGLNMEVRLTFARCGKHTLRSNAGPWMQINILEL